VPFGSAQVGQISPSGVNYKEVYLNDNGEVNKVMDDVVEGILKILRAINEMVGTKNFHHVGIENLVKDCIDKWHKKGYNKLDLAEFCIMIIVQICCPIKVGITGHKDLHNLVYPVSSLGWCSKAVEAHIAREQALCSESNPEGNGIGGVWH
jgi:hypothetical protein